MGIDPNRSALSVRNRLSTRQTNGMFGMILQEMSGFPGNAPKSIHNHRSSIHDLCYIL